MRKGRLAGKCGGKYFAVMHCPLPHCFGVRMRDRGRTTGCGLGSVSDGEILLNHLYFAFATAGKRGRVRQYGVLVIFRWDAWTIVQLLCCGNCSGRNNGVR